MFLSLEQNLLEGPPEVSVKNSVYDGIQAAVAVSNPEKQVEECVRDRTVLPADSMEAVREEKGEPAQDKNPHHYCQNKCEALLPHLSHFVFGKRHPPASKRHRRGEEEMLGALVR